MPKTPRADSAGTDTPARYLRFVALGDSFTEGLDDPYPDGTFRGWADRFADLLAAQEPQVRYANLAVRGKKIDQVVDEQVPAALALQPDLVSFAAGVNDVLRPKVDISHIATQIESSIRDLKAAGSQVILTCVGDPSRRSALLGRVAGRIEEYDGHLRSIGAAYGCAVMDFWGVEVFDDERCWSVDRLHLSPIGHDRVARAAADVLGFGDDTWRDLLPPATNTPWLQRRRLDIEWAYSYLGPWVGRRLRGTSSGDSVLAKRPRLTPVLRAESSWA